MVSLTFPFLCISIPPHSLLCSLSASPHLFFSVSLWPSSVSGSLPAFMGPALWILSLPPSFPPTENNLSHPQGEDPHCPDSRTWYSIAQAYLLLHLYCSPGDRPSFLLYSSGISSRWFSLSAPSGTPALPIPSTSPHLRTPSRGII